MAIGQIGFSADSKESLAAKRFKDQQEGKVDFESLDRTESAVRQLVEKKVKTFVPGTDIEGVIAELKKSGFILPEEKKEPEPAPKDLIFDARKTLKIIEDEELKTRLTENKFFESLEKDIFNDRVELNDVYKQSLAIKRERIASMTETEDYYYKFAELVPGGTRQIKKDLEYIVEHKRLFREHDAEKIEAGNHRVEKINNVATIIERSLIYCVSNLKWYGPDVSVEPVPIFNDIMAGVDDLFVVKTENSDSFVALGVDITYRSLLGKQYREKVFKLLESVQGGHKTRIKYFTDDKGNMMEEFVVPKMIMFFDLDDVKDLVYMIKNMKNPEIMEKYKNSPQRFKVMNQILVQCEILAEFAEEAGNAIADQYREVVSVIKELSLKNDALKEVLERRHEDQVAKHMKYLISEFKNQE